MKILLSFEVDALFEKVKSGFNKDLFLYLQPSLFPIKLIVYEGEKIGQRIELQISFLGKKNAWNTSIINVYEDEKTFSFTDKATKLPFGLRTFTHTHRLIRKGKKTIIQEDIDFSAGLRFFNPILKLFFIFVFKKRGKKYQKYFKNNESNR